MAKEQDQEFVEMIVKQIVEHPDKVETTRTIDERGVLIELKVDAEDMGKIIGKEGRTAKSIRTLLRVLGARSDSRVNLKIAEPEGSTYVRPGAASDDVTSGSGSSDDAPATDIPVTNTMATSASDDVATTDDSKTDDMPEEGEPTQLI